VNRDRRRRSEPSPEEPWWKWAGVPSIRPGSKLSKQQRQSVLQGVRAAFLVVLAFAGVVVVVSVIITLVQD
jgi:hypothetical protein